MDCEANNAREHGGCIMTFSRKARSTNIFAGAELSPRERQLMALLWEGLCHKEIANRLFISIKTVQTHLTNIYAKAGLPYRSNAVALMRWGIERGYVNIRRATKLNQKGFAMHEDIENWFT